MFHGQLLRSSSSRLSQHLIRGNKMSSNSPSRPTSESGNVVPDPQRRRLVDIMDGGISPRVLLNHIVPSLNLSPDADDMMLWRMLLAMTEPPKRKKLTQYNTIDDAVSLIKRSQKIIVLSGAGISTSAGLPDFRSRNGIYVQIHAEHPDLQDPKFMFDIEYFRRNPLPFFQFAQALFPGQFEPTIGHQFIKCIENHNKLLRNYTQNIDTLEMQAGIKRVVECHGSFAKATCTSCKYSVDGDAIRADIFDKKVPKCPKCHSSSDGPTDSLGVMKPNIVFFGEQLGENFHSSLDADKTEVDLLVIIGSSLKVRPVALIPRSIPENVPQILINKEPLDHMDFDIELLGNCDDIIQELCLRLGDDWSKVCRPNTIKLQEIDDPAVIKIQDEESLEISPKCSRSEESNQEVVDKSTQGDELASNSIRDLPSSEDQSPPKSNCASDINFGSDKATIASDIKEPDMIETVDEDHRETRTEKKEADESAISDCDKNSDDDWEDLETVSSVSSSLPDTDMSDHKLNMQLPESSYVFLRPNRYVFNGAELNRFQLDRFTKAK